MSNILSPSTWSLKGILPLDNPKRPGGILSNLGFLVDWTIKPFEDFKFRVFKANIYMLSNINRELLLSLPFEQYNSDLEILDAGWRVC